MRLAGVKNSIYNMAERQDLSDLWSGIAMQACYTLAILSLFPNEDP